MPTLIFGTLHHVDRERRRILVGTADLPVGTNIPLEFFHAGMPIKVVTDVRGGQEWVAVLEVEHVSPSGPCGQTHRRGPGFSGGDSG